jgi:hypothetical protein
MIHKGYITQSLKCEEACDGLITSDISLVFPIHSWEGSKEIMRTCTKNPGFTVCAAAHTAWAYTCPPYALFVLGAYALVVDRNVLSVIFSRFIRSTKSTGPFFTARVIFEGLWKHSYPGVYVTLSPDLQCTSTSKTQCHRDAKTMFYHIVIRGCFRMNGQGLQKGGLATKVHSHDILCSEESLEVKRTYTIFYLIIV